ncbi:GNAT family N-acetyltransferase [Polaribacter batillariae]|uniref:GNAT family N-acetyltransferase n=1 Tax=Polaribacter batillariae TaxID=2808900 RepID=A0ABX7SVX6_9FLAO|nr:GNAT family N-acetyltransferase [Polaribacter batillariae]QTD37643.1 GNAT family N-acetyltransferase [Polaribacter batillariae]
MKIYEVKSITDTLLKAINILIPQLTSSSILLTKKELEDIITSENTVLFIAEEKEIILGTLTLVLNKIPTGSKAWIEDVVVDEAARGKGVGKKITQFAVDYALNKGITKIDLTSSPERIAANNLYQKLGFKKRKTNVYRLHR